MTRPDPAAASPSAHPSTVAVALETISKDKGRSRFRNALSPLRIGAAAFLGILILATAFANFLALPDPIEQDVVNKLLPIGDSNHLLGTDQFGRDTLARLVYGARVELLIALGATALAAVFGTILGLSGGYFGRWIETLTMRGVDVILAFPPIILALLVVTIYGPGMLTLIVVMGLLFAPAYARLTYGEVVSVRNREYVEAARVFGSSTGRTMFGVVLPNVAAPILVQLPLTLAGAILLESGLSFLGLGVVPPTPSWGLMVADGQRFMSSDPQLVLLPSAAIALTILAFGIIGDFVRDWLDPRRSALRSA